MAYPNVFNKLCKKVDLLISEDIQSQVSKMEKLTTTFGGEMSKLRKLFCNHTEFLRKLGKACGHATAPLDFWSILSGISEVDSKSVPKKENAFSLCAVFFHKNCHDDEATNDHRLLECFREQITQTLHSLDVLIIFMEKLCESISEKNENCPACSDDEDDDDGDDDDDEDEEAENNEPAPKKKKTEALSDVDSTDVDFVLGVGGGRDKLTKFFKDKQIRVQYMMDKWKKAERSLTKHLAAERIIMISNMMKSSQK